MSTESSGPSGRADMQWSSSRLRSGVRDDLKWSDREYTFLDSSISLCRLTVTDGGSILVTSFLCRGTGELPLIFLQKSSYSCMQVSAEPATSLNIEASCSAGSFDSWIFAPRSASSTANPLASAELVMNMSIPNLGTNGVSQRGLSINVFASLAESPKSPPMGCLILLPYRARVRG